MSERSQFRLLAERRFGPFFAVQFLGAMNDNVFKQALVILLAYQTAAFTSMSSDLLQNVAQAVFILPFFLFSATAGQLADKFEKSRLITITVALELGIMMLGAAGLLLKSMPLLLTALFLGGVQSSLFGPVKYAILPQSLKESELVGGNALVETSTSIAILIGMIVGGWMIAQPGWGIVGVAILTCALSAFGIVLSRFIPPALPPDPGLTVDLNPVRQTVNVLRLAAENRTVFNSILGISWFWLYGALLVTQFPNLVRNVLHGNEHAVTLLLVVFSTGIGAGSLLCERLSGHKVELGLVPFGSIGLTLFGLDLGFAASAGTLDGRILLDLFFLGVFGGLYIVPLYALVQSRSDRSHRSRIIGANNILNALFIVIAAGIAVALLAAGLSIPQLFIVGALMNAAVAIYIYTLVPEFLMRFIVWLLIHSVYRLRKVGLERIPEEGAAIIVCNHVSYVDALVISAACRRPIRWVMDYRIFRMPVLSFVFRTAKAIPIAPAHKDPAMLERAYEGIARELADGQLVGIFPEGKLTSTGEMNEFRGGIMKILERTPVPVVPMALSGLWRTLFTRNRARLWHAAKLFPRIQVSVGEPVAPAIANPQGLQAAVLEMRGEWR
jgi:1-acyl-sn-glycerol-3-phosphate acyltransferase